MTLYRCTACDEIIEFRPEDDGWDGGILAGQRCSKTGHIEPVVKVIEATGNDSVVRGVANQIDVLKLSPEGHKALEMQFLRSRVERLETLVMMMGNDIAKLQFAKQARKQ